MSQKHIYRHFFTARLQEDLAYDPNSPESYTAALEKIAAKRKALLDLGFSLVMDHGKPIALRDAGSLKAAE